MNTTTKENIYPLGKRFYFLFREFSVTFIFVVVIFEFSYIRLVEKLHLSTTYSVFSILCCFRTMKQYPWIPHVLAECDRVFVSNPDGPSNGTFSAPEISIPKGHSRQCIYTFIASENERVQITFLSFNLRGAVPEWVIFK